MAAELPSSASITGAATTNAQQKLNFAAMRDVAAEQGGTKSGIAPQTVASAATLDLDAVVETREIVISGTIPITAVTVAMGKVFRVRASGAFVLTNNSAIVTQTGANIIVGAGDTFELRATAVNTVEVLSFTRAISASLAFPRNYFSELGLSTVGSSATMTIAAGQAADSANTVLMTLSSAISKTTSSWSVGSAAGGKSETGAVANNTWYHWYEIRRPDTGVVDICYSTSAIGLVAADYVAGGGNVPDAYTQFRHLAVWRTNGSAQWESILQDGDYFQWLTPPLDVNATNPGTSAVTRTLSVPTGVNVLAEMNANLLIATSAAGIYLSDLATVDLAPSFTAAPLATFFSPVSSTAIGTKCSVRTNTSAQIRSRLSASDASSILRITTTGWTLRRGRGS